MFANLFSPFTVRNTTLKNRVVLPPHAHVVSTLWGSEEEARRHFRYWKERSSAGWIDGVSAHVRNNLIPGFEPTGVGSQRDGHFRQPYFIDRVGKLAELLHADDSILTVQMISQGGMPHAASHLRSGPVVNQTPHALTTDELDWYVSEYSHGAKQVALAGADGVELHMNHDDMVEYFISPLTNAREDDYGGNLGNRLKFPLRVLKELRRQMGPDRLVGVRLNLREEEPGGYGLRGKGGSIQIARALEKSGLIDYVSCTIGSPWGNPSYIQSQHHKPAEWSILAREVKDAVSLPVIYTGKVNGPSSAESILTSGHADLVGIARAIIADDKLLNKAREGRIRDIRPCVGGNECISRRIVEGTPFSCAVNPAAGRESDDDELRVSHSERILVIGGGPSGMEFAGIASEIGHRVTLWEQGSHLGGQLRIASNAPQHDEYNSYLVWQERRLNTAGVQIRTRYEGNLARVGSFAPERIVVATGAEQFIPDIPGVALSHVHRATDVLCSSETTDYLGRHVLIMAQDDHIAPLSIADFLATRGHDVTLVHGTASPAPLVSRYVLGSILSRLDDGGVALRGSEQVTRIDENQVTVRHVYSGNERTLSPVDSVVVACGAVSCTKLQTSLRNIGIPMHIIGDAYAPRRLVFATKQARELALTLHNT